MGDILKYRIPGKEKVEKRGFFAATMHREVKSGFVLFAFDKYKAYTFQEDDEEGFSFYHFRDQLPNADDRDAYLARAAEFKKEIIQRELSKAILSRVKIVQKEVDPDAFFEKLCEAYPNAFVYLVSSTHFGTWIGATPEPLIIAHENIGTTVALAGTKPSEDDTEWGEKEKEEQFFVQEYIAEALESLDLEEIHMEGPVAHRAGPVQHLKSTFHFSLEGKCVLDVARRLHPTPAVSGSPQRESIKLITESELHDRSLYCGFLGEVNDDSAHVYVNLRCAQLFKEKIALYLGGGYTKDSIIEYEWEETENKAKTLLSVTENL